MARRVLFYVQHLLGIGHLVRAVRIAGALSSGFEVTFVVGGEVPPGLVPSGVEVIRLAPVKAGEGGFVALVHPDGRPFDAADQAARRQILLDVLDRVRPDVLLIEAFPFGRRQMRFELLPLLERARAAPSRPLVACSVRDILQVRRPDRDAETLELIRRFFDLVLVHGDPAYFPLAQSFPQADAIAAQLRYTGMVGPAAESLDLRTLDPDDQFDVVVSVGGGAVGAELVRAAVAAKPLSALAEARWLVLTGPNLDPGTLDCTDDRIVMRGFDPRLPQRLAVARLSISQAGYNTVVDLLSAGCRPVLVPFGRGGETEQTRRAEVLAKHGWAVMLAESALDPVSLAAAIDQALALRTERPAMALKGAEVTRTILERALEPG